MENLILKQTETTPFVFVNCEFGQIEISGICIPENPYAFLNQ